MTLSDLNNIDFGNNNLLSSFNFPNYKCIVAKIKNEINAEKSQKKLKKIKKRC